MYLPAFTESDPRLVENKRWLPVGQRLAIDTHRRQVVQDGTCISTQPYHLKILSALTISPHRFADRDTLMDETGTSSMSVLNVAVQRTRRLFKENELQGYAIESEYSGYRLQLPEESSTIGVALPIADK